MPNLKSEDVVKALSFLAPWNASKLQQGNAEKKVEEWLQNFYGGSSVFCFDSGRSALYLALKACQLEPGDEVLVQAYTCAVVSNAIVWSGAKPVYVDITTDFTMDVADLEKKITQKSKVLIIQHTFGIPADIVALQMLAKQHNLLIIEDCAHVMGGTFQGQLLGTFGDIGMISFGSEKPVSCGRGGALLTNNSVLAQKISVLQSSLSYAPRAVIQKQLFTFIVFFVSKPFYFWGVGKWLLGLLKKFNRITKIIEPQEKRGENLAFYPSRLPHALADILIGQLSSLHEFNRLRHETAEYYKNQLQSTSFVPARITQHDEDIYFLRFPLVVPNPAQLHTLAKEQGILLGDWYTTPIAPADVHADRMGYCPQSCPVAEKLASQSINLPTHYSLTPSDRERIVKLVQTYARSNH